MVVLCIQNVSNDINFSYIEAEYTSIFCKNMCII